MTHTPVVTSKVVFDAYKNLENYNLNVYAIDFSCTGKSSAEPKNFSPKTIIDDFNEVIDYIKNNYSDNIHVFGNCGIGGIFAQYAVSSGIDVRSFAQFACVTYEDTSILKLPLMLSRGLLPILKLFRKFNYKFKEPKYKGLRAELDDEVYKKIEQVAPDFRSCKISMLYTLVYIIVGEESLLKDDVECPTLVFKTLHDRYFTREHFDKYYENLSCKKQLVEVDDVHNSYIITPDVFSENEYNWFVENS